MVQLRLQGVEGLWGRTCEFHQLSHLHELRCRADTATAAASASRAARPSQNWLEWFGSSPEIESSGWTHFVDLGQLHVTERGPSLERTLQS